jgi:acyl carrier protein
MADSPLLLAELTQIVRTVARIPVDVAIGADTRLVEDLSVDSLDLVGISMKIEDRYGIQIDVDEVPNFHSLADISAYVTQHRSAEAA